MEYWTDPKFDFPSFSSTKANNSPERGSSMNTETRTARVAAGLIALIVWVGLAVQFSAVVGQNGSVTESVWVLIRYFTILTNLLAALFLTRIAFDKSALDSAVLLGGLTMSMVFVGVIYVLFLRGLLELSGGASLANFILHYVAPILVLLFWLAFVPKGALRNSNPLLWVIYPLAYGAYALARGTDDGKFAYPFIDVAAIGWLQASTNIFLMSLSFLTAGFAMVCLDRVLGGRKLT
jgi:hypothetical protein